VGGAAQHEGRRNGRQQRSDDHSLQGNEERENEGEVVRKVAEKGRLMSDAGSCPSRRRVVTAGLENPLPIVRLPARDPYRTPRKRSLETISATTFRWAWVSRTTS